MLRHIEWHQELCATLRPGKGIVEGCDARCVRHDGVFRQGESLDFIHAIGALLIDRDVPGNQVCLVLNGAAQLLPVRPVVDDVKDALVIAELFGQKGMSNPSCRLRLDPQRFKFMVEHGALGGTQAQR